jgi:hypothetical protein
VGAWLFAGLAIPFFIPDLAKFWPISTHPQLELITSAAPSCGAHGSGPPHSSNYLRWGSGKNMAIDGTKRSVPPVNMYISWFCHLEVTWQVWGRDRPIKLAELHYMSSSAAAMRTWTARDQTCNLITCPNLRLLWNASMRKPRIWVCRTHTK